MGPGQARFVTACQQLLALGVVLAVLTPAASVVSLDVVGSAPDGTAPAASAAPAAAFRPASAVVPTEAVDPVVKEYPLTAAPGQKPAAGALRARVAAGSTPGSTQLVAQPEPVTGYGAVGVTWSPEERLADDDIALQVRTRTGEVWSEWTELGYDAEHGPDPDSPEGRHSRPGTDALLVGEVDQVQVKAESTTAMPADLRLAVIDPGASAEVTRERPAIDTSSLGTPTPGVPTTPDAGTKVTGAEQEEGAIALQAAAYTPKPQIFSRAQWGANESMRDKGSLHYFEVHAGFVHHTVNSNSYTRAQVPALLRGIYAYHTRSRGWSDIGYNFLVDRFGRIWEGRAGGVDRPVVGAHTLGYNDYSFAMSAIGNFETVRPKARVLRAYGALFAWKLSLHGVSAASTSQQVGPTRFRAINGHRDAAATACPGRYLYAKLARIRALAAADQASWAGRERSTDLTSTPDPDLLVRRASDGRAFLIPTGGTTRFAKARSLDPTWGAQHTVVAAPDLTGDGRGDLLVRGPDGLARVHPGVGAGKFGEPLRATGAFRDRDQISAVGDLNEDGHQDLVGRASTGRLNVYLGTGRGTFARRSLGGGWSTYSRIAGTGDVSGDGHVDLVAVDRSGRAWLRKGNGAGKVGAPVALTRSFAGFDLITGLGDYTRDGRPDLFVRSTATGLGSALPSRADGDFGKLRGKVARVRGLVGVTGANVVGNAAPDLVGRRGGAWLLLPNRGTFETGRPVDAGFDLTGVNRILNVGDWDGDGHGDVVLRSKGSGNLVLRRGDGSGGFSSGTVIGTGFSRVRLLAAVGDMTGDGRPDLMGQPAGGSMRIYPGAGSAGLRASYPAYSSITAGGQIGVGRFDADGAPDSLLRRSGELRLYPGNGPGGLTSRVRTVGPRIAAYNWILGLGDVNRDGHADLVTRARATGDLWLLPGTGTGFGPRQLLAEDLSGFDLAG